MTSVAAPSWADILAGRAPKESPVTLRGWVRTRRDSKAGISFVHVSDGSRLPSLPRVAPRTQGVSRHAAGLGPHATGLEGRYFLRARFRRLVLPSCPGGRAEHARQLRGRGDAPHRRLRGGGHRRNRAVTGERAALRD